MLACGPYLTWTAHSTPYQGHCHCPHYQLVHDTMSYFTWVAPRGLLDHTGGLQNLGNCPSVFCIFSSNILAIIAARQGIATVIISLQPHCPTQRQQIQTKEYGFYSLPPPPLASGFFMPLATFVSAAWAARVAPPPG